MSNKRRSHPPTLLRLAEREIREGNLVEPGSLVLAAVSGGPDSMALMHVLSVLRARLNFTLRVHAVSHGLRPEALDEVALVEDWARRLDVQSGVSHLQVPPGSNLQARARQARMAALRNAADAHGAAVIALGHHADDRAETVLLRIMRGAGPAGLAVMGARAGDLIRPFIRARRADVLRHLYRHEIPFAQDPSNEDRRFLRAQVRWEVLPLLESISPRVVQHLCQIAEDLDALALPASPLGREQLRQLARAATSKRPGIRVSLPAGRVARVDLDSGRIVVELPKGPKGRKGTRKPRHGLDEA